MDLIQEVFRVFAALDVVIEDFLPFQFALVIIDPHHEQSLTDFVGHIRSQAAPDGHGVADWELLDQIADGFVIPVRILEFLASQSLGNRLECLRKALVVIIVLSDRFVERRHLNPLGKVYVLSIQHWRRKPIGFLLC